MKGLFSKVKAKNNVEKPEPKTVVKTKTKYKQEEIEKVEDEQEISEEAPDEVGLSPLQKKMLGVYSDVAEKIERELFVSADLVEDTGFYINSLVASLLLGKITSSMYVISGAEQSAKSSLAAMMMGASLKNGTLINKHADVENAMRSGYMAGVIECASGIPWKVLQGSTDEKGKRVDHSRYRWHTNAQFDSVFDDIVEFLESLPYKVFDASRNSWFLAFENASQHKGHLDTMAKIKEFMEVDKKKSNKRYTYFSVGDDDSLQAVILIDSIKMTMLRKKESGLRISDQPAGHARELAKTLPFVKGHLREKHVAFMCINQVMENPLSMQNRKPAEYETAGNALKINSDVRCIMAKCAVQSPFEKSKADSSVSEEDSVLHEGMDVYQYKSIKNIKNKLSVPNFRGHLRIWMRGADISPGIDPVYDAAYFYTMIGLARLGSKAGRPIVYFEKDDLFLDDDDNPITMMEWPDFKYMILSEYYGKKEAHLAQYMQQNNICQLQLLREGFKLLESGEANQRIIGRINRNEIETDHTADE